MSSTPHSSQSQKKASAESQTAGPETLPASGVAEPDHVFWGDRIALQVWLICSLLMWLIGLCSVCAGLSK